MDWNGTVIGALIGGALTAMGFIYKKRLESIALLNKSLYQLLILYRSVSSSKLTPTTATELIIEVLHEVFPGSENDPSIQEAKGLYRRLFSDLHNSLSKFDEENLLPLYLEAVKNLSSIDPVLAYRLSANAGLKAYLMEADEKTKAIREAAANELSPEDMKFIDKCYEDASELLTKDVIHELKVDLLLLSFKCGIVQFISVLRRMLTKTELSNAERKELKSKIKRLLQNAIQTHQANI